MKSILMTTSAVFLVTGFAAGQAHAACPEDIDAFNREYEQTLQNAAAGEALSAAEQAQLFGLRTAAENLHQAGNAEMCTEVIQRANLILESAIAPQVIRPDELVGREVTNAQEEDLGEIEDVMIDPVSGRIAYIVIEYGGFLGIGGDLFAVPWRAIQFVPGNDQTLLLDIPEDKLENAPRFSREDESPLERREWVTSVHSYYGVQPYWQDDVGAMAMQYGGGGGAIPAATGDQAGSGQGGEVKTIVVPITEPEGEQQPQSGTQSEETDAQPEQTEAQPEGTGSETEQEGGPDTQSDAQSDTQGAAEPPAGAASLVAAQPQADSADASSADIETLVSRMDQLEQQVEELAQKDIGAEVEQSIASLEQQVQSLSEKMPGEDVTQAIERLEKQVAALGETPGQAAEQGAGASDNAGQAAGATAAPGQSGQSGQGAQSGESGQGPQSGQSGQGAQSGESGQQQGGQTGQSGGQTGQQQAGRSGQAAPASSGSGAAAQSDAASQGEQQGQAGGRPDQSQAGEQAAAAQAATTTTTGSTPSAADEAGGQTCGEQITKLEEDLKRAEELGVETEDAQSDLEEAKAMLNNNSEALCRAAIKRAQEELVAVGFEPTQSN